MYCLSRVQPGNYVLVVNGVRFPLGVRERAFCRTSRPFSSPDQVRLASASTS